MKSIVRKFLLGYCCTVVQTTVGQNQSSSITNGTGSSNTHLKTIELNYGDASFFENGNDNEETHSLLV